MTNYQTEIQIKVPLDVAETYWNATEEGRQKIEEKSLFIFSLQLYLEKNLWTNYIKRWILLDKKRKKRINP
ncbi:MAG UNVERIFIED_CONTAM: hypothetical protein LVR29_28710 [Microcystis novacekii LVE1205-3]|jgi:hypothetical protein